MTTARRILKDRGMRPKKRLGQSFLQDQNIMRKIIAVLDIQSDQTVVEIGAGLGFMTALAAEQARHVIALEVDPSLVMILKDKFKDYRNVEIIQQDVLKYDFSSAVRENAEKNIKILGNVPYYIASPILFRLLDFRRCLSTVVLLLQKEMVDRITAFPGTKDYGIPSVILSMFFRTSREMDVPGSCFYPEPRVNSAVLKMTVRNRPLAVLSDEDLFSRIVRTAFSKRRKTLLNNLRSGPWPGYDEGKISDILQETDIDGGRRAETLSAAEFGLLSNAFSSKEKS
jgi:16S rRNA (adenine1518-N6/adenine1519-N6)-dimethyltransferase